jgi:hypothetical protein
MSPEMCNFAAHNELKQIKNDESKEFLYEKDFTRIITPYGWAHSQRTGEFLCSGQCPEAAVSEEIHDARRWRGHASGSIRRYL